MAGNTALGDSSPSPTAPEMKTSARFRLRLVGIRATLAALFPIAALAAPVPANAAAGGAAVAAVVVSAADMVTRWIEGNSDDVKASAAVVTSGSHGRRALQAGDSGFSFAGGVGSAPPPANGCAPPSAVYCQLNNITGAPSAAAFAFEGLFGAWSGLTLDGFAFAPVNALHSLSDMHKAEASWQASVDGTLRGENVDSLNLQSLALVPVDLSILINPAEFQFGSPISRSGLFTSSTAVDWFISLAVNGQERFFTRIALDGSGNLTTQYHEGIPGLPASIFDLTSTAGGYQLRIIPNATEGGQSVYRQSFFQDLGSTEGFEYSLSGSGGGMAVSEVSAVPEPSTWLMLLLGFASVGAVLRRSESNNGRQSGRRGRAPEACSCAG